MLKRAFLFLGELKGYETAGRDMPRLQTVCLDSGSAGELDLALGILVQGVSESRFWAKTAVFVVEAGGLGGKDVVGGRRSPAFVVSPYVRRRSVDSTMYNTLSVVRTMELILGLRAMTHFDAAALPLAASFQATPDTTPFESATRAR
jgi:hypothetical protein